MKFIIERNELLKSLKKVSKLLCGKPSIPILGNILLKVTKNILILTSTDLEIEIITNIILNLNNKSGTTTVSSIKFFNICRSFPDKSQITVLLKNNNLIIYSDKSKYVLSTIPAYEFPNLDKWNSNIELNIYQNILKKLIESTFFSMANQDIRYYLNGMLFEITNQEIRTVATDGHRLALCTIPINNNIISNSVIIPRKGVIELLRILNNVNLKIKIQLGQNNIRVIIDNYIFTSKLISSNFPNYRLILNEEKKNLLIAKCNLLKKALNRVSIISNEKFCIVRFIINTNKLIINATNKEKEKAEEILEVIYNGIPIEIGLNINYILDIINSLKSEKIKILIKDKISSIQIKDFYNNNVIYVIMPIRL